MNKYVADFETTTDPQDVRVWASCIIDIDTFKIKQLTNNIDDFFMFIETKNSKVYFHNLKFDGEFIIHWLLSNGYTHTEAGDHNYKDPKTFSTIIDGDSGAFYNITIYFKKFNKRYKKCEIFDSLKKLPFSVKQIAKTFKLEESKLSIDYKEYREVGHELTDQEKEYIIADCMIVAKALKHQFDSGLERMTIGSDALNGFKTMIGKINFEKWFPVLPLDVDEDIRRAYKGGYTHLKQGMASKRLKGLVLDVNSLYPWALYNCPLPYGYPIFYQGEYTNDPHYPLYIQRIRCSFEVKKKHLPTIQIKGNNSPFVQTEYLRSSKDQIVELTLTSVDLALFLEHYDTYNLEYICGYMFKECRGVFNEYINYWMHIKENSEGGTRQLAKLMLNSLYGKFATNPKAHAKIPKLNDDGSVRYEIPYELVTGDDGKQRKIPRVDMRDPVYTAVGAFCTAWARDKTIRAAQANYDRFIYADTDSLHLIGWDLPEDLEIHKSHLGAWKHEGSFVDSKFLRAKTYIETYEIPLEKYDKLDEDERIGCYTDLNDHKIYKDEVKCAGMPDNVKQAVTYDNFTIGSSFSGNLKPHHFKGGIVLMDVVYTIQK